MATANNNTNNNTDAAPAWLEAATDDQLLSEYRTGLRLELHYARTGRYAVEGEQRYQANMRIKRELEFRGL
jgi:hypothetical protein